MIILLIFVYVGCIRRVIKFRMFYKYLISKILRDFIALRVPLSFVFSSTLFDIAIKDITNRIHKLGELFYLFIWSSYFRKITILQSTVDHVQKWWAATGYQFSIDKFVTSYFCERTCPHNLKVMNEYTPPESVEFIKYLSTLFDNQMA